MGVGFVLWTVPVIYYKNRTLKVNIFCGHFHTLRVPNEPQYVLCLGTQG